MTARSMFLCLLGVVVLAGFATAEKDAPGPDEKVEDAIKTMVKAMSGLEDEENPEEYVNITLPNFSEDEDANKTMVKAMSGLEDEENPEEYVNITLPKFTDAEERQSHDEVMQLKDSRGQLIFYQLRWWSWHFYGPDKCCCQTYRQSFRPTGCQLHDSQGQWTVLGNTWVTIGKCRNNDRCGCGQNAYGVNVGGSSTCTQQYQYHRFLVYKFWPFQMKYLYIRLPDFCQCMFRSS